ncbi:MAG: hypothetical protein ACRDZO_11685 [Egibacteraceae bacterium]
MAPRSTSFRISEKAKQRLSARAKRDGVSVTALLERLIMEDIEALDHPGIIHRGPPHDRRAALAGGPDVWEIIARLRELEGSEEKRIATLVEETDLHPRQIRIAINYAAEHADETQARIERNEAAAEASRRAVEQRQALFA